MCLAIGATVNEDTGAYLMLTDASGPIPSDRKYGADYGPGDRSWMIGLYADPEDTGEAGYFGTAFDAADPGQDEQVAEHVAALVAWGRSAFGPQQAKA